ncbi:MAG: hypothetical protein ACRERD_14275 [Candidatus Binatia bacterium]
MPRKEKLGTPRGVGEWRNLETSGDCKRLFKWLIHSIRDGTIPPGTASIMAQIGGYLLKAVETADLEQRIASLEHQAATVAAQERRTGTWEHANGGQRN